MTLTETRDLGSAAQVFVRHNWSICTATRIKYDIVGGG